MKILIRSEKLFKEVENISSGTCVADQIFNAISSGKLSSGDKLPAERLLTDKFKVSRPVLREAISALSFMGIIQKKHGKGNYIAKHLNRALINNSFKYMLISKEKEVEDLLEARKTIECKLISLAALRKNELQLSKMRQTIEEMGKCKKTDSRRVKLDFNFHLLIAESAQNKVLRNLQMAMRDKVIEIMKVGVYLPEALTISETEHLMMYQAIARSDAENAELIMEKHIEGVKIRHIRKLESIDNSQIKMK